VNPSPVFTNEQVLGTTLPVFSVTWFNDVVLDSEAVGAAEKSGVDDTLLTDRSNLATHSKKSLAVSTYS
jgi:hypothetical protein